MEKKKPTYKKATSRLMQHLLSRYLKHDTDFIIRREEDYSWKLSLGERPFEGALVVPFLISNVGQWYIGLTAHELKIRGFGGNVEPKVD